MNSHNHVYAIMELTPATDLRYALPAIRSFSAQTWPYRSLSVVCRPPVDDAQVREAVDAMRLEDPDIEVRKAPLDGDISQVIRAAADEDLPGAPWGVLWQPDCWSHPDRLAFQLASAIGSASGVRLRYEIRMSPAESSCRMLLDQSGIPSTELFKMDRAFAMAAHPHDGVVWSTARGQIQRIALTAVHPWPLRIRFLQHNGEKGPDPAEASLFYRDLPTGFLARGKTQVPDHVRAGLPDILEHYGLGLFASPASR